MRNYLSIFVILVFFLGLTACHGGDLQESPKDTKNSTVVPSDDQTKPDAKIGGDAQGDKSNSQSNSQSVFQSNTQINTVITGPAKPPAYFKPGAVLIMNCAANAKNSHEEKFLGYVTDLSLAAEMASFVKADPCGQNLDESFVQLGFYSCKYEIDYVEKASKPIVNKTKNRVKITIGGGPSRLLSGKQKGDEIKIQAIEIGKYYSDMKITTMSL